ncbi:catalase [Sporosarcina aquimarina]|uniref:catalase n=1 Tax=Sporosarcina aquimarina TaxID=114975 RepID=UPI00203CA4C0|nr:catalase [Sporosarcina aquimarina]MCM3757600.1 catalase [Sporosarcina aquimarina]
MKGDCVKHSTGNNPEMHNQNAKQRQLGEYRVNNYGKPLTTNQSLKVSGDENSLKAGVRGPTLLEDFHLREKITHFDHERIPERVVHARGYAAHGEFVLHKCMKKYTTAKFLHEVGKVTPLFTRFSTVVGSRGSTETARDVRGFAVKFYTEEGNYDLVGNNIPVFFIQDAIKFPDLIHAAKPEPQNEFPQAATAHDTFWDFVANNQESAHMIMWTMSDRAIPVNFRKMQGFGVHTFRFVNSEGKAHFVKFHWKPRLGIHSLVWDEAQKIGGKDPDFHRRDLYESIEAKNYPKYDLGVQIIREEDEFMFDFDILDATKIWPEEIVPVEIIGTMTLNRNVDNVFAETEQVAFHPGNVVPGIDFTNDPLLQGRLFSYLDTQLLRLGGPNFAEIPINRPVCPFHNNQRDGFSRQRIDVGQVSYHKNSLADNTPSPTPVDKGGYEHYQEKVEGHVIRAGSPSFDDHFSQARLFWNSMAPYEKQHIIDAFSFEVGKVQSQSVRQQVVDMFCHVDSGLSAAIANAVGVKPPECTPADTTASSPALSMENTVFVPETLKVAILIGEGFDSAVIRNAVQSLRNESVTIDIVSEKLGTIKGTAGKTAIANQTFITASPVLYDSILVGGGASNNSAEFDSNMKNYIEETWKHYKPIAFTTEGSRYIAETSVQEGPGIIVEKKVDDFYCAYINALAKQRFWERNIYK